MALLRGIDDQIPRCRTDSLIDHSFVDAVACAFQRDQIRFRAATGERAKALRDIDQDLTKPANHARLDNRRRGTITLLAGDLIQSCEKLYVQNALGQWRQICLAAT